MKYKFSPTVLADLFDEVEPGERFSMKKIAGEIEVGRRQLSQHLKFLEKIGLADVQKGKGSLIKKIPDEGEFEKIRAKMKKLNEDSNTPPKRSKIAEKLKGISETVYEELGCGIRSYNCGLSSNSPGPYMMTIKKILDRNVNLTKTELIRVPITYKGEVVGRTQKYILIMNLKQGEYPINTMTQKYHENVESLDFRKRENLRLIIEQLDDSCGRGILINFPQPTTRKPLPENAKVQVEEIMVS